MRATALLAALAALAACAEPTSNRNQVRVVTFGDSNIDVGYLGDSLVVTSYIDPLPMHERADEPNSPLTLAGKLEVLGAGLVVRAVNHGLGLSTSDTGDFGPPSHQANARQSINGVTRFEAEVLGVGAPSWAADSPAVARVQAFRPGPDDYAVVGIGGNDVAHNLSIARTAANWRWMVARWAAAGLAPSHLLLVTLTPRIGVPAGTVPDRNDSLRAIAAEAGATVIDLCAYVSDDAGESWRSDSLNVGDGVHYSDGVRTWLARRVLATINP